MIIELLSNDELAFQIDSLSEEMKRPDSTAGVDEINRLCELRNESVRRRKEDEENEKSEIDDIFDFLEDEEIEHSAPAELFDEENFQFD